MTVQPTSQRKGLVNDLILALKTAGVWQTLDALYVTAAHDAQAARCNWIADQFNLTPFGSPAFTADQGYKGDAVAAYLDTGFVAASSLKFLQDDASVSAWVNGGTITDAVVSYATAGGNVWLTPTSATGTMVARVNNASASTLSAAAPRSGLFTAMRDGPAHLIGYRNGALTGETTPASTARVAVSTAILRRGTVFVDDVARVVALGGSRSAAQELAFYNALFAYLTAVGASI